MRSEAKNARSGCLVHATIARNMSKNESGSIKNSAVKIQRRSVPNSGMPR